MTNHDLEQRLRAWYRADIADGERAPHQLRADLATLLQTASSSRRALTAGWRFPSVNRFAPLALVATAVVVALLIGIGLIVRSPDIGPSPIPGPTHNATQEPNATPEPTQQGAAAWTATGAMAEPRAEHKATLLPDGRVLVVGNMILDPLNPSNSSELYDPGTGTWAFTGSMVAPRFNYSATLLANGKVLVAGGTGTGAPSSAELYDPISGTWSATGSMVAPYYFHTATRLLDGKVLVAGDGSTDGAPSAQLYDPVSGAWSATGAMVRGREGHTATLLPDGRVLVAGGTGAIGVTSAELYDPVSGSWTATGAMATGRYSHTATLLPDGRVLVAGGHILGSRELCSTRPDGSYFDCVNPLASAELYDPQSGAWSTTQRTIAARAGHTATLLPDGRVLLAGGRGSADESACQCHEPLGSAELYDPANGTWSATASMVAVRSAHTATLLPDGRVLVASGNGMEIGIGGVMLASAELYDPGSGD